jgi:AraC-like DNA-binding protein
MDLVILISLLNASTLAIAVLGFLMFINTPAYRGVCLLLALVSATAIANVFEDLRIFRELHLVSPIFVMGYGPALYFTVKRLVAGPIGYRAAWHFLPMLLLLPFTHYVQPVIAVGTLWRIVYAILTLKLIIEFNRQLSSRRSDVPEVSLAWLGWLIVISTLFNALDLLRLNFQPELLHSLNMAGYAGSAVIFLIIYMLLILTLNNKRAGLETLTSATDMATPALEKPQKKLEESAADYQSLFTILDSGLRQHYWYTLPRLTLNQLSELSGVAPRDISRCINLVAGMSFNDYINYHRIEKVKYTLQISGNTNLTDLAFAAGFSSKATFNQSFRKATGMTPSEFRLAAKTSGIKLPAM